MEDLIHYLRTVSPLLVYIAAFSIAFIENVFPPSPSDLVVVFAGSLAGLGRVDVFAVVLAATAGSTLGFLVMYKIGEWFGARILERGKIKFISAELVKKVEAWFRRYGYWLIVANRFLAGTRAVIPFFAGMAEVRLAPTVALSFVSALAWNTILVAGGYSLGRHWEKIGFYLTTYAQIVTALVVIVALILVARYFTRKNKGANPS